MKASGLWLILSVAALITPCLAQDDSWHAYCAGLDEGHVRKLAIKRVMPSYPEEAIREGKSGIIRLKIEIGVDGEILRIKVKPGTDSLLKKAAADAAKKWQLKPVLDRSGLGRPSLGRLTFHFVIRDGVGVVDLYNPGRDAPDSDRLGYYNSAKEIAQWAAWEEVRDN